MVGAPLLVFRSDNCHTVTIVIALCDFSDYPESIGYEYVVKPEVER
jgi:hypothetical protein